MLVVAVVHPIQPRPIDRPEAHRARFARGVDFAAAQVERAQFLCCGADGAHLGVCRGVAVGRDPVGTGGDDPAVPGDDCAEGASAGRYVLFGKPDGYPHQLLSAQGSRLLRILRGRSALRLLRLRGECGEEQRRSQDCDCFFHLRFVLSMFAVYAAHVPERAPGPVCPGGTFARRTDGTAPLRGLPA